MMDYFHQRSCHSKPNKLITLTVSAGFLYLKPDLFDGNELRFYNNPQPTRAWSYRGYIKILLKPLIWQWWLRCHCWCTLLRPKEKERNNNGFLFFSQWRTMSAETWRRGSCLKRRFRIQCNLVNPETLLTEGFQKTPYTITDISPNCDTLTRTFDNLDDFTR